MILNTAEDVALESEMYRLGIFLRLETDPVVRVWLGFGSIEPGVNAFDPEGARYGGAGTIQNVPAFKQLINGKAERVEFTISGVSGEILRIASGGDAEQVKGRRVACGFALMDAGWALLGPVKWCANYVADFLSVQQAETDDPLAPIVRTVSLSCGSRLTGRRRPALAYFTDQDQQTRFPGDQFCRNTPLYANGFSKAWPKFPPVDD